MTEQEALRKAGELVRKASELVDKALVVLMAYERRSHAADWAFEDLEDGAAGLVRGLEHLEHPDG